MEFCGGGSCEALYKAMKLPFSEREISVIIRESLSGLAFLHSVQKLHRDIKSGNILLTDAGGVKLADFGVSTQLSKTFSKRNTFIGTPCMFKLRKVYIFYIGCRLDGTGSHYRRAKQQFV